MRRAKKTNYVNNVLLAGLGLSAALLLFSARLLQWPKRTTIDLATSHLSEVAQGSATSSSSRDSTWAKAGGNAPVQELPNESVPVQEVQPDNEFREFEARSRLASQVSASLPLKDHGIFAAESQEARLQRLHGWVDLVEKYQATSKPNLILSAFPIAGAVQCDMFRTALAVTSTLLLSTVIPVLHCSPSFSETIVGCLVENSDVTCIAKHIGRRSLVISLSRGITSPAIIMITSTGRFALPIERPTAMEDGGVHVCVQSIYYPEETHGPMPDEHLETFIGHYSRLGVSDVHVYTNSTVLADTIPRIRNPLRTKVWYHDTPLPKLAIPRSNIEGIEYGFQFYVINDCLIRAKAMKASAALFLDLDEFLFPDVSSTQASTVKDILTLVVKDINDESREAFVIWFTSYMFNTLVCSTSASGEKPNWYHNFLEHFTFAKLDSGTYNGRRKSAFVFNGISGDAIVNHVWYAVHDITVPYSVAERTTKRAHLHRKRYPIKCTFTSLTITTLQTTASHGIAGCVLGKRNQIQSMDGRCTGDATNILLLCLPFGQIDHFSCLCCLRVSMLASFRSVRFCWVLRI